MSAKLGYEVGDFVIYDARLWRVGLVSELRMRLDPLTGNIDRKSTRLNSSHMSESRMPSSA